MTYTTAFIARIRLGAPILGLALLWGCAGDASDDTEGPDVSSPLMRPAELAETAPDAFRARFQTNEGVFVVEVNRAWAPNGADRFYVLVKNGFFDGARFFRVIEGFVAQFGLHADPYVTAAWTNYAIPDDPVAQSNVRGASPLRRPRNPTRVPPSFSSTWGTTPTWMGWDSLPLARWLREWRSSTPCIPDTVKAPRRAMGPSSRTSAPAATPI